MSSESFAPFRLEELRRLLRTSWLGREIDYHARVQSSNDRALQLARTGGSHGLLVLAEEQTGARGRHGRSWSCAPGQGVWATALLRPRSEPRHAAQIPLLAGLAFCEALALDLGVEGMSLRWPNDLDLNGRKMAGILCERAAATASAGDAVVAGFGINAGPLAVPPELSAVATSLCAEGQGALSREALLAACLGRLEVRFDQWEGQGFGALRADYLRWMSLAGRQVRVTHAGEEVLGEVETVDEGGALVMRTAGGSRTFHAGQVERVR